MEAQITVRLRFENPEVISEANGLTVTADTSVRALKALVSTTILNIRDIPVDAIAIRLGDIILQDDQVIRDAVSSIELSMLTCVVDLARVELVEPRAPSEAEYPRIIDASRAIESFRRVFSPTQTLPSRPAAEEMPDVRKGPVVVPRVSAVAIGQNSTSQLSFYHGGEKVSVDSSEYMLVPNLGLKGEFALCLAPTVVSRHPALSNVPPVKLYSKSPEPAPSQLFQEIKKAQEHVEKELTVEIEPDTPPLNYMEQRIVGQMRQDTGFRMAVNTISHLGNAWGIVARNLSELVDFVYDRRTIIFGTIGLSCIILANSAHHLPTKPSLLVIYAVAVLTAVLGILTAVERGFAALNSSEFRRNFVNVIASLNPEVGPDTHLVDMGTEQLVIRHNQPRILLKAGHISAMFFMSLFPGLQRQIMERTNELRNSYQEMLRKAQEERDEANREYEELEQYVDTIVTERRSHPEEPAKHDPEE